MKLLEKIFGKKRQRGVEEYDLGNGMRANSKGEIYGEIEIKASLNGKDYSTKSHIHTTIDKLSELTDKWKKEEMWREQNRLNPYSCERKPNEDEVMVHVDKIDGYMYALPRGHELGKLLFEAKMNALSSGYNNIIVSQSIFQVIVGNKNRVEEITLLRYKAKALEKDGEIAYAIDVYNRIISLGGLKDTFDQTEPYNRLMILYRKQKDRQNEIKIINDAISFCRQANERKAEIAIKENPEKENEILSAISMCSRVMGNDGFYIFIPYSIDKYKDRLAKLLVKEK